MVWQGGRHMRRREPAVRRGHVGMREVARLWWRKEGEEAMEHAAGGAPDAVGAEIVEVDEVLGAAVPPDFGVVDGGIGEGGERGVYDLGDFGRAGCEGRQAVTEPADEGDNEVAADAGEDAGQRAEDFDVAGDEAKLFVGFAQGGGLERGVGGVVSAAGEGDFAAVASEIERAKGEEQVGAPAASIERSEHGGGAGVGDDSLWGLYDGLVGERVAEIANQGGGVY